MDTSKLIKKLRKLAQLDVDATGAYEIAIEKIDIPEIKQNLTLFKNDHQRHLQELNEAINGLGGEVVENEVGVKGLLIQGMTLLRSSMGTESALNAMRSNEETTNETYDEALAESEDEMPINIRTLIIKNREDERKHLAYIEARLRECRKEA